jgi:hypothetical protein
MKEYNSFGKIVRAEKEEINNHWYYLLIWPKPKYKGDYYLVQIYTNKDGSEMPYIHPVDVMDKLNRIVEFRKSKYDTDKNLELILSQTINEAVCKIENKNQLKEEFEDLINVAFDANKEIHESDEN